MIARNCKVLVGLIAFCPLLSFADCNQFTLKHSVDGSQLWQDFSYLASDETQGRKTGSSGSVLAQDYLVKRFSDIGLQSFTKEKDYRLPFRYELTFSHVDGINIAGYLKGQSKPDEFIVISAHYDHIGMRGSRIFNGADDNASGVSALLAIAQQVSQFGSEHSVIFLATDAEEKGLYGSKAFVQNPPVELANIKYNLNLDMVSQNQGKNRLYVSGARYHAAFKPVVETAIEQAGLCLVNQHRRNQRGYAMAMGPDWRKASDHASFAEADIPYLFVGVSEHSYYHSEKDTVDKVDPIFFQAAVETSLSLFTLMDRIEGDE
ncbi:M28 family peptidase [Aliiglaciecola lipolytica]|uniref:Peptidase M28 domain-containing protein n=1 Tax=Aliiglaciecola lipolytica E3 TaxID=1127673 RepID=K6YB72_9ALTE|nr:M28 family peptidase [Aliiglaciecola lipolytica]GAC15432.1 hypothetical protein GLIP_2811 [Aliiglaciecola lipolytica E3]